MSVFVPNIPEFALFCLILLQGALLQWKLKFLHVSMSKLAEMLLVLKLANHVLFRNFQVCSKIIIMTERVMHQCLIQNLDWQHNW